MGESKTNDYTTEQLLDETLKNIDGESNIEVRKRMLNFLEEILAKHEGKRIVVVSHGAAIKFLLQHYAKYEYKTNTFTFSDKMKISAKLESPSTLKWVFDSEKLVNVKKL